MTTRKCPKCGSMPCVCFFRTCCPEQRQCLGPQHNQYHCAWPAVFTGEYDIGCRPCCAGLQKCRDKITLRQWCSETGKCPKGHDKVNYPPVPPLRKKHHDFQVKEGYANYSPFSTGVL
jgi:hypothetical protein